MAEDPRGYKSTYSQSQLPIESRAVEIKSKTLYFCVPENVLKGRSDLFDTLLRRTDDKPRQVELGYSSDIVLLYLGYLEFERILILGDTEDERAIHEELCRLFQLLTLTEYLQDNRARRQTTAAIVATVQEGSKEAIFLHSYVINNTYKATKKGSVARELIVHIVHDIATPEWNKKWNNQRFHYFPEEYHVEFREASWQRRDDPNKVTILTCPLDAYFRKPQEPKTPETRLVIRKKST